MVEFDRYESETLPFRKRIFKEYTELLSNHKWAIIPHYVDKKRESSYHLYLLRIKDITLAQRNLIIQEIFNQDVSVNVHYKPLPLLSFYKGLGYTLNDYPVAESTWECEISLPVYYSLSTEQIKEVVSAVVFAVEKIKSNA